MKDYLNLMPLAATAKLYGIFRLIKREKDTCRHITCGFKPAHTEYDWSASKLKIVKKASPEPKCSFERYVRCTTQELSDPNTKDMYAAITIDLITSPNNNYSDFPITNRMTFLFNLATEEVKDKWFQMGPNESVQPHQGGAGRPMPSTIKNIHEIIEGMKKAI